MNSIDVELRNVVKIYDGRGENMMAVKGVSLQIANGEFFALLGPSGCGKTTTLRMIAGFEDVTRGEILIRGQAVENTPPFHRPVNTVFQDYALFPHMTVLQNVMFGLQMENLPRAETHERAIKALELVQLPNLTDRKPRQLSGGQQQRVALARALVKRPAVLLLDEPLGALDLKLRKAMQFELKAMQQQLGITFIYVTHDQEEAMTMADRIAVMDGGEVLQVGSPVEIYEKPSTRFVAGFIGETNFVQVVMQGADGNYASVQIPGSEVVSAVSVEQSEPGSWVTLAIRPEKVGIFGQQGQISRGEGFETVEASEYYRSLRSQPRITILEGKIKQVYYIGTDTRYEVIIGDNVELVSRSQNFSHRFETIYRPGDNVYIYWDNDNARVLTH